MTTTIVELEDEETRHQQNARERAAQLERQQLQLTIAEQQQQQASGLGRRLSPNSATSPEGSSPGLRILAKPLQMLGRLFGDSPSQADVLSPLSPALEATNVPWSPVTKATEAPLPAAPIREAPSPPTRASPTLSPADVTPPASSPPTRSLQVPPRPPIKTVSAPRDQFQTSLAPPPSTYTRNHQPLPPPAHIMDEMSATDRSLLEDYELQLAMALSMSMDDRTPTSMAGTPNSNDAAFMAPTPPPASSPSCRAPPSLVKDYSVMSFNQDDPGAAQPSLLDVDPPAMDFAAALTKTSAASGSTAEVPRVPVHTVTSPLRQPSLLDEDFQSSEVDGSITPPMAPTSALMSPNGNNQRRSNGRE